MSANVKSAKLFDGNLPTNVELIVVELTCQVDRNQFISIKPSHKNETKSPDFKVLIRTPTLRKLAEKRPNQTKLLINATQLTRNSHSRWLVLLGLWAGLNGPSRPIGHGS